MAITGNGFQGVKNRTHSVIGLWNQRKLLDVYVCFCRFCVESQKIIYLNNSANLFIAWNMSDTVSVLGIWRHQALIPLSGNLHSHNRRQITRGVTGYGICVLFKSRVVRECLCNNWHLNRDLKNMSKPSGWLGEELFRRRKLRYNGLDIGDCRAPGEISRRWARVEWSR